MIARDIGRIDADARTLNRVLAPEEARTIAGYARTVADVAKLRKPTGKAASAEADMDQLLEQVASIPELRELVMRGQNSSESSESSEETDGE